MRRYNARTPELHARSSLLLVCLALLAHAGCSKREPVPSASPASAAEPALARSSTAPAPPPHQADAPKHVSWTDPPQFRKVAGERGMRQATYAVSKSKGDSEDGELAVFYFGPGMGGSVDANFDRWAKQFAAAAPEIKRDARSSNGFVQHTIEIARGTYASGMPGAAAVPKSEYGLLGAIVETPAGSYFFKLTGPSKTVAAARAPFLALLDSVKLD